MSLWEVKYSVHARNLGAALLALSVVACEDPKTFVPSHTDTFTYDTGQDYASASAIYQADYLFILDYSSSMNDKKNAFLNRMDRFVDFLSRENNDYRIAYAKGTAHGCPGGKAPCPSMIVADNFVHSKFLEPGTSSTLLDQILSHVATLGDPNALPPNRPLLLEAADNVLTLNKGKFLRSAAQLILIFLSDADDQSHIEISSNRTIARYRDRIRALKPDASYISARAWVGGMVPGCELKNQGSRTLDKDKKGERLAQAALAINGNPGETNVVGCVYDDEIAMLEGLARDVQRYTTRFALEQPPLLPTLSVRVDGVTRAQGSDFSYQASTNEIIFNEATKPQKGQRLQISYEVAYTLKARPKPASLAVLINGKSVPQSDSNGWSYIEAENRIVLNGSARPDEGAEIRVTYEAR